MAINTSTLKSYAPQARRDFIAAVKTRAARFGIVGGGTAAIQEQGDVAIINGQAYPRTMARQCRDLEVKIRLRGFEAVMEEVAYTWFNRFAAIRYMELHGYLDHGFRVLSHPAGETTPEILQHAEKVDLPGLKVDRVVELKLHGRKDEELYRMLLVAQCNALHAAMPFLFERINDETELLLPDNLLHSDSVIRQMVERIPEADWQEIEIIGWLYQFYISEKKDQVIGKVVKSEDIPAATQLFTPNWIVKYMVQNSLGAKWLATYPDSPIKAKMEYYIEPAEQPGEVQCQIEAETPKSLDPETLTFLDPATGSGHILVEAYDLFKEIYLERGYRLRDIPRLILEKNLYGLDIDDRAAQLSGFALMMRARADDRKILSHEDPVELNVLAIRESNDLDVQEVVRTLWPEKGHFELVQSGDLLPETIAQPVLSVSVSAKEEEQFVSELIAMFQDARTYGSLLRVSEAAAAKISALKERTERLEGHSLVESTERQYLVERFLPILRQAELLSTRYDVVAANPPYMGSKGMNPLLKAFAGREFPDSKSDLFAMFMERGLGFTAVRGSLAMINMQSWMFLSSFEKLRKKIIGQLASSSMMHLGARAFDTISGDVVATTAFVFRNSPIRQHVGSYLNLTERRSETAKKELAKEIVASKGHAQLFHAALADFARIPGAVFAYWAEGATLNAFRSFGKLSMAYDARQGLATADDSTFLRSWCEVSTSRLSLFRSSGGRWFPFTKGGEFRKWFGNNVLVVDWEDDGNRLRNFDRAVIRNSSTYFREHITWSLIAGSAPAFRVGGRGFVFGHKGPAILSSGGNLAGLVRFLNSVVAAHLLRVSSSGLSVEIGHLSTLPVPASRDGDLLELRQVEIAQEDWNSSECSLGFERSPLLQDRRNARLLDRYSWLRDVWKQRVAELRDLEVADNRYFIDLYGLQSELDADVPLELITLNCNPVYRYPNSRSDVGREELLCADTMREFISYAVGCLFGRYSLDEPGLILADQGDTLDKYLVKVPTPTFMPDADNIIPMLDDNWFEDDVTDRFLEFLKVTFGTQHFDENLAFIENAIGKDIRTFFKRDFFRDHLKRYKRRPIYWVFSSGKEKAFEAIVYMHRYNETTLARMRMNYVVPLQSQMASRVERLATELSGASLSSAERKRKDTQRAKLIKQLEELGRFEEELRHLADQRIRIDLDDGVKVNYGKFGNLLAEVKAVTGGRDD